MRSKSFRQRIWTRDGGLCQLCLNPVSVDKMSLDHKIPRSLGGKASFENLRAAHRSCNKRRGNGVPHEPAMVALAAQNPIAKKRRPRGFCKLCNSRPCLGGCSK